MLDKAYYVVMDVYWEKGIMNAPSNLLFLHSWFPHPFSEKESDSQAKEFMLKMLFANQFNISEIRLEFPLSSLVLLKIASSFSVSF